MKEVMAAFRSHPPERLAGHAVVQIRDYLNRTIRRVGQAVPDKAGSQAQPNLQSLDAPEGDLVILDLAADGNYVACRPSGTEPKIKFYMFAYTPPEQLADLECTKAELAESLASMDAELRKYAGV